MIGSMAKSANAPPLWQAEWIKAAVELAQRILDLDLTKGWPR